MIFVYTKRKKSYVGKCAFSLISYTASSLSFPSDLVRGVHARASVGRRSQETREARAAAREEKRVSFVVPLPSHAFSHARGHLRVSGVFLDGPRKKRGCSYSTDKCLKNNIIPSFCHNFDRFKSNIRTSYVTLCLFLLHTRVSTSSNP